MKRIDRRVGRAGTLMLLLAFAVSACDDTFFGSDANPGRITLGSGVLDEATRASPAWTGSGTEAKPWLITGAEALKRLIENVNEKDSAYSGKYFQLLTDIEIAMEEWVPIGTADNSSFSGYFDGNGKTISGTLKSPNFSAFGFFGVTYSGGSITNLNVSANVINDYNGEGHVYTGAIVGLTRSSGTISDCHVTGSVKGGYSTNGASYTGGLAGQISQGKALTCTVSGTTITGGDTGGNNVCSSTGGFTGYLSTSDVRDCKISKVIVAGGSSKESYSGGFAGYNFGSIIRGCGIADTQVSGGGNSIENFTGGIVGVNKYTIGNCTLTGGTVAGGTGANKNVTGGLAGYNSGTIHQCSTGMAVTGGTSAVFATGGLVGENAGEELYGCNTNTGTVEGMAAGSGSPDNRVGLGDPVNEETHIEPS